MGGLRAGNTEAMRPRTSSTSATRGKGGAATGQPFDMGFLARESFVYDTEPACRAVVTARRLLPDLALPFMARVSRRSTPRTATSRRPMKSRRSRRRPASTARSSARRSRLPRPSNETFRDFLTAQELGIRGFPTLIAGSEDKGYALLTNGYRPFEDLAGPLERWLAAGAPVTKAEEPQAHSTSKH